MVALLAANTGEGGTVTENPFAKGRLNVELKKARSVTECSNLMAQFGYQDGMVISGFVAANLKIIVNVLNLVTKSLRVLLKCLAIIAE